MRPLAIAIALAAAFASQTAQSVPPPAGARPTAYGWGYGGHWGGAVYRPWYGPGYRYGRWGYGYPGYYGYGVGLGYGLGWGYGVGSPWYWGAPAIAYTAPALYPYGAVAPGYPVLEAPEELTFVQKPQAEAVEPAAQPARKRDTYWYYCTEPAGYHPYVTQCSRPWIAVNPKSLPPANTSHPGAAAP